MPFREKYLVIRERISMTQCLLLLQLPAFSPNRDGSYMGETKII